MEERGEGTLQHEFNEIERDQWASIAKEPSQNQTHSVSSLLPKIAKIRSAIQSLEERRTGVDTILQRGIEIPPELLHLIFKNCVSAYDYALDIPLHPRSQTMTLSHVCAQWRQVALAEPSLWNPVSIDYPSKILPGILEAILSRAGNAITVYFTIDHIPHYVHRTLREYSDRFHTVDLKIEFSRLVHHLNIRFEQLSSLQKLRVSIRDNSHRMEPIQLYPTISPFSSASNLRDLDIDQLFGNIILNIGGPPSSSFPWSHLQHLGISCEVSLTGFLHILLQCTRLITCQVILGRNEDQGSSPIETLDATFTLGCLCSIYLTSRGGIGVERVLDILIAPSLRNLKIINSLIAPNTLVQFIYRSRCNLRTLGVTLSPSFLPDIEGIMRAVPSVVDLALLGCTLSETTLDHLGQFRAYYQCALNSEAMMM